MEILMGFLMIGVSVVILMGLFAITGVYGNPRHVIRDMRESLDRPPEEMPPYQSDDGTTPNPW